MNKLIIIFWSCLILLSCSRLPPGNPYYSLTIALADKLESMLELGPIQLEESDKDSDANRETFFIPDKADAAGGFIVQRMGSNFRFWYWNRSGILSNYLDSYIDSNYSDKPEYLLQTITGYTGALVFIKFERTDTRYEILQYNISTGLLAFNQPATNSLKTIINANFGLPMALSTNLTIKGAYYSPVNNRVYFLVIDNGDAKPPYYHYECNYALDNASLNSPAVTRSNSPVDLILPEDRLHYFYDVNQDISLVSCPDFTENNAFYWTDSLAAVSIPNLVNGIGHLLSSSLITSVSDNQMTIYNYQGENVHVNGGAVVLGGIQFLYEQLLPAGSSRMVFFNCTTIDYGDNREYYFNLYALPTTQIAEL